MNSIDHLIKAVYEQRQSENEALQEKRSAAFYLRYPELKSLDEKIKVTGLEMLKVMRESKTAVAQQKAYLLELEREKNSYLEKENIPGNYAEALFTCTICQDKGMVDGQYCSCYQQIKSSLLMEKYGLVTLKEATLMNFDLELFSRQVDPELYQTNKSPKENIAKIKNDVELYIQQFPQVDEGDLYFFGRTGTGKSYLLGCIANGLIQRGFSVLYLTASKLFEILRERQFLLSSFRVDEARWAENTHFYEGIFQCDLLLLDDLGTEDKAQREYLGLLNILNEREHQDFKTIISSNMTLQKLRDNYDERITSRILGSYALYHFYGPDLRLTAKKKAKA